MTIINHISTLAVGTGVSSTGPDSITVANGDIWVAYTNGADSTGQAGSSTIVEYDKSGHIDHTYQIAGSVDGLKFDPVTGKIWALQNQDGNSTLTIIDPEDHTVGKALPYAVPSAGNGMDDVVFTHGDVFMSRTNPTNPGDATLVELTNGNDPHGPLKTKTILDFGDKGINLANGNNETIPQTDPDSLKLAPNGDLLLSGGGDQTIIDVHAAGTSHQTVAFTTITGATGNLDDVLKVDAGAGTFYLSDTADNRVLAVHASDLNTNDYFAAVGNAFGEVDPLTGKFTALVTGANAPDGFKFGSVHGIEFVADHNSEAARVDHISTLAVGTGVNATGPDSITLANGDIWVAYTNGADSTGLKGHSTVVEYDKSGHIDHTYQIAGSVDGLKFDPATGDIWALQNQDGNSTLTIIDPEDHTVSKPLSYAVPSDQHGIDDVVFTHGDVFLSRTNPVNPGDATLVELTNGNDPHGPLKTETILAFGDKGINTATGNSETIPQNDPDSLKLAPNGDLLMSSGSDQTIIDVHKAGTSHQSVTFTNVKGAQAGAGIDDVLKVDAEQGTFYLADTADNRVLAVHATGLNTNDYFASIGNAFGVVDPKTGEFTALVSAANAPGFKFGSAHGAEFVADHNSDAIAAQGHSVADTISQIFADVPHPGQGDAHHDASPAPDAHPDWHAYHLG